MALEVFLVMPQKKITLHILTLKFSIVSFTAMRGSYLVIMIPTHQNITISYGPITIKSI